VQPFTRLSSATPYSLSGRKLVKERERERVSEIMYIYESTESTLLVLWDVVKKMSTSCASSDLSK